MQVKLCKVEGSLQEMMAFRGETNTITSNHMQQIVEAVIDSLCKEQDIFHLIKGMKFNQWTRKQYLFLIQLIF